jgi:hypothetical protein
MGRTKFGAVKIVYDNITFDSMGEGYRYVDLKNLQKLGIISNLQLQPKFDLVVNGVKVCVYRADFQYTFEGNEIVEDFKGVFTALSKLKVKLFQILYPQYKFLKTSAKDLDKAHRYGRKK